MKIVPDLALVHVDVDSGRCVACGKDVPRGIVGWSFAKGGPICDMCFVQSDAALGRILICHEILKEAGEILAEALKPIDNEVAMGALMSLALNHYKHCGSSRMIGVALGLHLTLGSSLKTH